MVTRIQRVLIEFGGHYVTRARKKHSPKMEDLRLNLIRREYEEYDEKRERAN
jgi:hypothetical protein